MTLERRFASLSGQDRGWMDPDDLDLVYLEEVMAGTDGRMGARAWDQDAYLDEEAYDDTRWRSLLDRGERFATLAELAAHR